jgi:hypothetical protein
MTADSSTKQSIASSIASLALNPAEALGGTIAKMMDTPSAPRPTTAKKWQIDQSLDQYENAMIERKKH